MAVAVSNSRIDPVDETVARINEMIESFDSTLALQKRRVQSTLETRDMIYSQAEKAKGELNIVFVDLEQKLSAISNGADSRNAAAGSDPILLDRLARIDANLGRTVVSFQATLKDLRSQVDNEILVQSEYKKTQTDNEDLAEVEKQSLEKVLHVLRSAVGITFCATEDPNASQVTGFATATNGSEVRPIRIPRSQPSIETVQQVWEMLEDLSASSASSNHMDTSV